MTTVAAPRRATTRKHEPTVAQTIRMIEALTREKYAEQPTIPAWCARCDQHCRLMLGPGGELCVPCMAAEVVDRLIGQQTR